jgi:hypothetical protein
LFITLYFYCSYAEKHPKSVSLFMAYHIAFGTKSILICV